MKQLNTMDAGFLYVESHRSPMHIAGVYIFEGTNHETGFSYENFRDYLASRLHIYPVFQQRLVEVPLDLGLPYWYDDPNFDIEHHISYVALPAPAEKNELFKLAAQIFNRPLDRQRPLWEITVVTGLQIAGLPEGSFALIPKVHHAALDGKAGVAIMQALFDTTPIPRLFPREEKKEKPKRIPTNIELLARHTGDAIKTPFKLLMLAEKGIESVMKSNSKKKKIKDIEGYNPPPAPFTAPKTFFNVPVTPHRIVSATEFPLEKVKKIKDKMKVTVNDVILSVCGGALRHYLSEKNALPDKSLITMAPVSVRTKSEKGKLGNKISAMLVALSTDEADPVQRLKNIHANAGGSKAFQKAVKAEKLMDYIPSQVAASAARIYTRMKIAKLHNPIYNLVITNVPGPAKPLYMNGHQLLNNFAIAPLIDGMGLMITVFSYSGVISIGATSCREIMPDLDTLTDYIHLALEELEKAVAEIDGNVAESDDAITIEVQ